MRLLLLFLALGGLALPAAADQAVNQGDYVVHYAAIATNTLTPEIAARYGVARGEGQALLVLNAQRGSGAEPAKAVSATASGSVQDLVSEARPLQFRVVNEDGIDTLVSPFRFDDLQVLNFDVKVLPAGATVPLVVRFRQQFFSE